MVKISVDSGEFSFASVPTVSTNDPGKPLKVLILGGFSGSHADEMLSKRRQYRVDKDNFDEVFSAMGVKLTLPFSIDPIPFKDYSHLHPDHLYDNISVFERYRVLLKRLRKPSQFEAVIDELRAEGIISNSEKGESPVDSASEIVKEGISLEALLSASSTNTGEDEIQSFIRRTVAPYVEPKEHPKVEEYSFAIEQAINHLMRQIMHAAPFQQLEASWRSVDLLNRRVDTDGLCKLHIMDVNSEELLSDLDPARGELHESELYMSVIADNSVAGGQAYDVILVDLPLVDDIGVELLSRVSKLAELSGAIVFSGAEFSAFSGIADSQKTRGEWARFRQCSRASSVYVTTPSVMLRLPYGKKTSPIDSFGYEELPVHKKHDYYLWGNSAYLLLIAMIQALTEPKDRAAVIARLPIHVYTQEAETVVQPAGEQYLSEGDVANIEKEGGVAVQSVRGTDQVMITHWVSVAQS